MNVLGWPAVPRLLAAEQPTLDCHHREFGELPSVGPELISMLDDAGLRGRGGAGYPTGRKMAAITGRKPVVVGNGTESEPLSRKDVELMTRAPHLILDGLIAAANAISADRVYLCLHVDAMPAVTEALRERRAVGDDLHGIQLVEAATGFVAGEESAAVRKIEGGPGLPRHRIVRTAVSGVRGRPTLVNNVETLAHIGLIARFGSEWFRSVGERDDPGTMLITVSGAVSRPGVVEVPTGTLLTDILEQAAAADPREVQAVLVGGYHGSWLSPGEFTDLRLSRPALKPFGASPGAGVIHSLNLTECGLIRTAEITEYLSGQSANQCGPCSNGLPRLAELVSELAHGRVNDHLIEETERLTGLVDGRGACRHPDGTARMVRSALSVFAGEIERHRRNRCIRSMLEAD